MRLPIALAIAFAVVLAIVFLVEDSRADLENQVFTSPADRIKIVVPRGWVSTDQPSYPGLQLWMMRDQPAGRMVLTTETFSRQLYCSWPVSCRTIKEGLPAKYACSLRQKLAADKKLRVGPVQAGPKENDASGVPSAWFEYDDGHHFVRQALALSSDRAISLVLVAATNEARTSHARSFEQALRTLQTIEAPPSLDAGVPLDALDDASTLPMDGAVLDAGLMFESAPAPKIDPVGPCP